MRLPQNRIIIASLLVLVIKSCRSSRYSQLTIIDNTIKNFINEEDRFWSDINSSTTQQSANATLSKLYTYFDGHLHQPDMGSVDAVRTINQELAGIIDEIKRTQQQSTQWLTDKRYQDALQSCDNILSAIPNEISQIFDITKSPPFLQYIRDNSDFCQTNKRIVTPGVEELHLQNVVMDFYTTVAETLVKGYMTSQMAYMIQGIKSSRESMQLSNGFFFFIQWKCVFSSP